MTVGQDTPGNILQRTMFDKQTTKKKIIFDWTAQ